MKRLLCWLLDHKNTITVVDEQWRWVGDECERCRQALPKAYPYHREFSFNQPYRQRGERSMIITSGFKTIKEAEAFQEALLNGKRDYEIMQINKSLFSQEPIAFVVLTKSQSRAMMDCSVGEEAAHGL